MADTGDESSFSFTLPTVRKRDAHFLSVVLPLLFAAWLVPSPLQLLSRGSATCEDINVTVLNTAVNRVEAHSESIDLDECGDGCSEEILVGGKAVDIYVGTNQSVYRIGDVVLGTGQRWERDRQHVMTDPEFNGTLMQRYFQSREVWNDGDVDFHYLGQLCQETWGQYTPREPLAIHFRNGDNVFDASRAIVECAKHYRNEHEKTDIEGAQKVPVRLVTIQHYGANEENGKFFASQESIRKGNRAVEDIVAELKNLAYDVTIQSSEDPDIDFCTLFLANDTCLSKGGFDSVVNAVRESWNRISTQKNFEDVRYFNFYKATNRSRSGRKSEAPQPYNSNYYLYGDTVLGKSANWQEQRRYIMHTTPFKGTLLQKYFQDKKHIHVDWELLVQLCSDEWGYLKPQQSLVLHQTSLSNSSRRELRDCAAKFAKSHRPGAILDAKIVTTLVSGFEPTVTLHPNVRRLVQDLRVVGYQNVTTQTNARMSLKGSQAWESSMKAFNALKLASDPNATIGGKPKSEAMPNVPMGPVKSAFITAEHAVDATRDAAEAFNAAASDADFCTLLLADASCLGRSGMDVVIKSVQRKRDAANSLLDLHPQPPSLLRTGLSH